MHKIKTAYKVHTKNKQYKPQRDPFKRTQYQKPNPERLSDNGTLDTFLHRIRTEMLDENLYKQNKHDNLTRKERIALRELMENRHIIINKADKGSTIVVTDREDYVRNAMTHLNDKSVYKPLDTDLSPTLKQTIVDKLTLLKNKGFIYKESMV